MKKIEVIISLKTGEHTSEARDQAKRLLENLMNTYGIDIDSEFTLKITIES